MRHWEGGFHGRLNLAQTSALHHAGRRTSFVTQSRTRTFDLPENRLVRATCARLLEVLQSLRVSEVFEHKGWAHDLRDCEGRLRHLLLATPLREVAASPVTTVEENAALLARDHAYRRCLDWWCAMRLTLDSDDPTQIARVLADGALLPLHESVQFELAVVIRLAEALAATIDERVDGPWRNERALVVSGRSELFAFVGADSRVLRIYYNQSVLSAGPIEASARHYLSATGRMRPDITLLFERDGQIADAVVIECKHSDKADYVLSGLHEAFIYRDEYAEHLRGCPKSMLVASSAVPGQFRVADDVAAASWEAWPPRDLVTNLLSRLDS